MAAPADAPGARLAAGGPRRRWGWGWQRGRALEGRGGGLGAALLLPPPPPLLLLLLLLLGLASITPSTEAAAIIMKRSFNDQSVRGYLTERACWWNEICKEEFQTQFRCKCPQWSYCRSPGRYYNAYCTVTGTGYIWTQPGWGGSSAAAAASVAGT